MSKRRKILLVIMDQFRGDLIDGVLSEHIDLPNMRAFQNDAVSFAKHFSVTNPCGPSRASIMTGMYAMNHRSIRNGTPLADGIPNIATELRKSGYDPQLFGYTDTSADPRNRRADDPALLTEEGVLPGFTEALEMRYLSSYPWRTHLKSLGYDVPAYEDLYKPISPDKTRPARPNDPPFYSAADSDTAFLTDQLIASLSVRSDESWFATATYIRPHPPLVAPAPYNTMYNPQTLPLPNRRSQDATPDNHPFSKGSHKALRMDNMVRGVDGIDAASDVDAQTLRALYLGLATEVDTHFGRIISFLKDSGQYDDTTIILMSDHGEMLGDHHLWGKQTPHDPAYHIPLIIRDPQQKQQHGSTVHAFTESVDVTPTILDLVGQHIPSSMNGASLRPFLDGKYPDDWRDCVHMELDFGDPHKPTIWQETTGASLTEANLAILREDRFKLIHFNAGLAPILYDLDADPHEMHNLADDPSYQATLLRMTQKLLNHRMRHADRTLADVKNTPDGVVNFIG